MAIRPDKVQRGNDVKYFRRWRWSEVPETGVVYDARTFKFQADNKAWRRRRELKEETRERNGEEIPTQEVNSYLWWHTPKDVNLHYYPSQWRIERMPFSFRGMTDVSGFST